jgi:hypothetical protein
LGGKANSHVCHALRARACDARLSPVAVHALNAHASSDGSSGSCAMGCTRRPRGVPRCTATAPVTVLVAVSEVHVV